MRWIAFDLYKAELFSSLQLFFFFTVKLLTMCSFTYVFYCTREIWRLQIYWVINKQFGWKIRLLWRFSLDEEGSNNELRINAPKSTHALKKNMVDARIDFRICVVFHFAQAVFVYRIQTAKPWIWKKSLHACLQMKTELLFHKETTKSISHPDVDSQLHILFAG